jgi:hypothetical protein
VGWLLEALSAKVPVNLQAKGLQAHMAIIGQSGSGKSFMLGRLLEEIASKTKARMLIIDPNSDFGQFGAVADDDWKFDGDDSREAFKGRWDRISITTLTQRRPQAFPEQLQASVGCISVSWGDLRETLKASCLGISVATHPEEYLHFQSMQKNLGSQFSGLLPLEEWQKKGTRSTNHVLDRLSKLVACPCRWEEPPCRPRRNPVAVLIPPPAGAGSSASTASEQAD